MSVPKFSRKLASAGRARTRTIGWGDRSVTFEAFVIGGTGCVESWNASRGDRHVSVSEDDDVYSNDWWSVRWVGDDMRTASRGCHDSLESALYAAREWLLGGEG